MRPEVGHTITWRRAGGTVDSMRVDWVHETDTERWLFSGVSQGGGFIVVNSRWVLGVR